MEREKSPDHSKEASKARMDCESGKTREHSSDEDEVTTYEGPLLDKAIAFLVDKGWTLSEANRQLSVQPSRDGTGGLGFIFDKYGVRWEELGYSAQEIVEIVVQIWSDEMDREVIRHLYDTAAEYNGKYFYSSVF